MIFSIEMSRWEIISKSISRHTVIESIASNSDIRNAKTARGITEGSRYSGYSNPEKDLIKKAVANYRPQDQRNCYPNYYFAQFAQMFCYRSVFFIHFTHPVSSNSHQVRTMPISKDQSCLYLSILCQNLSSSARSASVFH